MEHLQQFMVYLYKRGLAPSTIQGKLSAVAFQAKSNGYRDTTGDFRVRKMIEGWSKERGRTLDTRAPISPDILERMCTQWRTLCRDEYEISLFHAASLIAFFGALRISELVAQGKADKVRAALQWGDVKVQGARVELLIRRSKADQRGKGRQLVLGLCSNKSICPVRAVNTYLEYRGSEPGYFFQHADKSPLTKYQFWKLTGLALQAVGIRGARFGTHSFRIGAASTAAAMGYSTQDIKRLGRWSSSCYKRYIRTLPTV